MQKTIYSFLFLLIIFFGSSINSEAQYSLRVAFPNLSPFSNITELANANDDRLFVTQLNGLIYVFNNSPSADTRKIFIDLRTKVTQSQQIGLHGIAFHPDYINNRYFYVHYGYDSSGSKSGKWLRISRFQTSLDPDSAVKESELTLIRIPLPNIEHNGGKLAFGNDGYLYIALGDGDTEGSISQDKTQLLGKLLRINVDSISGIRNYSIPVSNPFYENTSGYREEIYAYGLRNPWKFSFDYSTDKLWLADVGAKTFEEINLIENGKNYGWNKMEGFHCYPDTNICDTSGRNFALPIFEYKHRVGGLWEPTASITGGYVYIGNTLPGLYGKYIYGDFIEGKIWALAYDGLNQPVNTLLIDTNFYISSFGVDRYNEIYICKYSPTGSIIYYLFTARDAGVTSVAFPANTIYTGTNVCFTSIVKNFGLANLSQIPVSYKVNDSLLIGPVIISQLNSGDTSEVSFCNNESFVPSAAGSYTIKFFTSVENDTNYSNDTAQIVLNVIDSSRDAGVTSVAFPANTIYTGTNVCFTSIVKNFGLANLSQIPVSYKVNDSLLIGPVIISQLNSGDTSEVSFCNNESFVPSAAGSYTIKFFTSVENDTNYSNDTAQIVLNVIDSSRDAGVTSVSFPTGTIYTGANVCFTSIVKNFGLANLSQVPVSYKVNDSLLIGPVIISQLNSGDTSEVSFCNNESFVPSSAGSYTIKFFTSVENDTNYSNDTAQIVLNVIDSSRDAGVTSVAFPDNTIYTGANVCFTSIVKNFGLANLSQIPVSYKVNDSLLIGPVIISQLNSGDTTEVSFCNNESFVPSAAGSYTIKFFTSVENDTNYSNDTAQIVLNVIDSSRDAGVTSVSFPTGTIYTGTNVCFTSIVKNFGLANLSQIPVSYKVNDSLLIGPVIISQLNSGDTSEVSFCNNESFVPSSAGSYTIKFFTSVENDTNYSNDTAQIVLNVIDSSRDAGVTSVAFPDNTIYTGTNVCFTSIVKNFGLANLSQIPVSYKVNDSLLIGPVIISQLNSGDTTEVSFCNNESFVPSAAGSYTIKFFTSVENDTNYSNDTAQIVLNVIDSSRDAGVTEATTNQGVRILTTGAVLDLKASIKNFGKSSLSDISVSYAVNGGAPVCNIIIPEIIHPGDSQDVEFRGVNSFVVPSPGNFVIKIFTHCINDINNDNDTLTLILNSHSSFNSFPFAETFTNPAGWSVIVEEPGPTGAEPLWGTGIVTNPAGKQYDTAARCNFYGPAVNTGRREILRSPLLNFSSLTKPVAYFYVTYRSLTGEDDSIDVLVSTDLGATFFSSTTIFKKSHSSSPSLATRDTSVIPFVPDSSSQWRHETIDLSNVGGLNNVIIAFRAKSNYGNLAWIDNVIVTDADDICTDSVTYAGYYNCNGTLGVDVNTFPFNLPSTNYMISDNSIEKKLFISKGAGESKNNTAQFIIENKNTLYRDNILSDETSTDNIIGVRELTVTEHSKQDPNFSLNSIPVALNTTATTSDGTIYSPDRIGINKWFTVSYSGNDRSGYICYDVSIDVSEFNSNFDINKAYIMKRVDFTCQWECLNTTADGSTIKASGLNTFSDFGIAFVPSLQITIIPQGLYNLASLQLNLSDSVTIYLRSSTMPFEKIDSAKAVIDSATYKSRFDFRNATPGTYYIVANYRNSIETWSKSGGENFTNGIYGSYDFTSEVTQAYGNNMILIGNKFCIYSGDVNKDGDIDGIDLSLIENAANNFLYGYFIEDCNGDYFIDGADAAIADNNAYNFISIRRP